MIATEYSRYKVEIRDNESCDTASSHEIELLLLGTNIFTRLATSAFGNRMHALWAVKLACGMIYRRGSRQ